MEIISLALFMGLLLLCIMADISVLFALAGGYVFFFLHAIRKGLSPIKILQLSYEGICRVRTSLLTFALIGMLTALWRCAGTIPAIVTYSMELVVPEIILPLIFWMNCLISFLTGTSFGTVATMGVICMTVATAMQVDPMLAGGAIMSGIYFGDRCSPVSASALLIAEVTGTNIYDNIRAMVRTSIVPFVFSSAAYLVLGMGLESASYNDINLVEVFSTEFRTGAWALIPALTIVLMSLLRAKIKITLAVGILASILTAILYQNADLIKIADTMIFGYHAESRVLQPMIDGGGLLSMVKVAAIVCISASYSGIFRETGMLAGVQKKLLSLRHRLPPFALVLPTAILTCAIGCNQSLGVLLTSQICEEIVPDRHRMACYLENSVIVLAPMMIWSIAAEVPLAATGAPAGSLVFAFYLYMIPAWTLITDFAERERRRRQP